MDTACNIGYIINNLTTFIQAVKLFQSNSLQVKSN